MKFVKQHRNDILKALNQAGFAESDFDFVKSRGRIHVKHSAGSRQFAYLRVKETTLDHNLQWQNSQYFKIKVNASKEYPVADWEELMMVFNQWLKEI